MYGPVVYGYGETAWSANVVVASLKTVCRLGSNLTPERSGTFADTVTGTLPVRWLLEMRTSFVLTVRTPTFALNVSWGTVVVSAWSFTMKRLETSEPRNSHCGSTVSVMPTAEIPRKPSDRDIDQHLDRGGVAPVIVVDSASVRTRCGARGNRRGDVHGRRASRGNGHAGAVETQHGPRHALVELDVQRLREGAPRAGPRERTGADSQSAVDSDPWAVHGARVELTSGKVSAEDDRGDVAFLREPVPNAIAVHVNPVVQSEGPPLGRDFRVGVRVDFHQVGAVPESGETRIRGLG